MFLLEERDQKNTGDRAVVDHSNNGKTKGKLRYSRVKSKSTLTLGLESYYILIWVLFGGEVNQLCYEVAKWA